MHIFQKLGQWSFARILGFTFSSSFSLLALWYRLPNNRYQMFLPGLYLWPPFAWSHLLHRTNATSNIWRSQKLGQWEIPVGFIVWLCERLDGDNRQVRKPYMPQFFVCYLKLTIYLSVAVRILRRLIQSTSHVRNTTCVCYFCCCLLFKKILFHAYWSKV